jgi:hypothetical protein
MLTKSSATKRRSSFTIAHVLTPNSNNLSHNLVRDSNRGSGRVSVGSHGVALATRTGVVDSISRSIRGSRTHRRIKASSKANKASNRKPGTHTTGQLMARNTTHTRGAARARGKNT